jgi:hypothetical protein
MSRVFGGPFGNIIRGIIKLAMAPAVASLTYQAGSAVQDITMGNSTIPLSLIFTIIGGFVPILLIWSGLRDLGVNI